MNTMSLLRNSVIVGGATFLVGSAFMEIGKADSKSDIGKWPYVATFLSGALGFYLLKQNFIPVPKALELNAEIEYDGAKSYARSLDSKFDGANDEGYFPVDEDEFSEMVVDEIGEHTTLDAESSSSLQSFAAEVFMADRKIRRRTRWTWTRGMEDGFEFPSQTSYEPHYHSDYEYKEDGAYHISDLPEGYHLHLYKPRRRSKKWIAYAKSPQSEEWKKFYSKNKSYLTPQLLEWYNLTIAKPTKQEMTPIMQMLIDTGSASGEVKISRVVIPEVPNMKKMPDGTKQKVGIITKEEIKFFGTKPNEKPKLLATQRDNGYDFSMSENGFESLGVLPFMQGLAFMGSQAGTTRSVNRYNKNREQWVKSYPAWFQNTVSNGIDTLEIKLNTNNRFNNILENGSNIDVVINDVTVATINRGERFYSRKKPYDGTEWITSFEKQNEPKIKVMGEEYPPIFILNKDGKFEQPRPSTQRKIYQNSMVLQDDGTYKVNGVKFVMEITDRYKFEKQKWLRDSMINIGANLDNQSKLITSRYQPIMKTMLRRFKKNDK